MGGHVFVYRGLLKNARNAAEVAGVLAHEIGHITQYHSVNRLVQASMVENVNGIIFGEDTSSLGATITGLLENMAFLKYSKEDEYQADSCSVVYTENVSINPYGMKTFLGHLRELYGNTPKIFETFSDHPRLMIG